MIQGHTVELDEVQLHYVEAAGPGPALVVLHGIMSSHDSFVPLLPALAKHAHVYAPDLRGHNLSGRTPGAYQLPDYGRDVLAFLMTVVRKPAFLAGHSLGALVALWVAGQAPNWVRGLFLEDPPLYITQMPRFRETDFHEYFVSTRDELTQHHAAGRDLDGLKAMIGSEPVNGEHTMLEVAGPEAVHARAIQLDRLDLDVFGRTLDGLLLGGQ